MVSIQQSCATSLLLQCPRDLAENLRWRRWTLTAAKGNRSLQRQWISACGAGPDGLTLWVNTFAWVYEPRPGGLVEGLRAVPFVAWPVQEEALRELYSAITEGRDVLMDKSRDMGASWLCLLAISWFWLCEPAFAAMLASRVEDLVDRRGDPDCLFWKLDYVRQRLPAWMQPHVRRQAMHIENLDNRSVISGSSTNQDLARGGRRRVILLDEFAAVDQGDAIYRSTSDSTPCRIFNSTPKGMGSFDDAGNLRGNAFGAIRHSGRIRVITLHWSRHPTKGCGLYRASETDVERLDDAPLPPDYPFIRDGKLRSPWYDAQCARRVSKRDIAENLDIDYLGSGDMFFDADVLRDLRAGGQLVEPTKRGAVCFKITTSDEGRAMRLDLLANPWRDERLGWFSWWGDFDDDDRPARRDSRVFAAFADIGLGTGASNSTLAVGDMNTGEVVGMGVSATHSPEEWARCSVAVCQWLGGQRGCLLGWETNGGHGLLYGREVWRLRWSTLMGKVNPTLPWQPGERGIGWNSDRASKHLLLGECRIGLARRAIIVHDAPTVGELEQYVYFANSGVGPAEMVDEAEGARDAHGDRVIAHAGLWRCMNIQRPADGPKKSAPPGSYAWLVEQEEAAKRNRERD